MIKYTFPLACALALAWPALVTAQASVPEVTWEHFMHIDKDKSGTISESEYRAFMEDSFRQLDTDGNGRLTASEAAKVLTPEQFAKVDANRDGEASRQEFMDEVMGDFRRLDLNQDGQLHP